MAVENWQVNNCICGSFIQVVRGTKRATHYIKIRMYKACVWCTIAWQYYIMLYNAICVGQCSFIVVVNWWLGSTVKTMWTSHEIIRLIPITSILKIDHLHNSIPFSEPLHPKKSKIIPPQNWHALWSESVTFNWIKRLISVSKSMLTLGEKPNRQSHPKSLKF